ncbi:MAG TPA: PAS domain S-box protein, partial [Burkholderiales bacterium]|nr:PAS domain S-box protein [Burkholderiales bacterium]
MSKHEQGRLPEPDYRRLFESAPVLYVVLDREFRVVAVSDAYLRATMTTRDEMVGRSIFAVFPANPGDPEGVVRNRLERVLETGESRILPLQRYDVPRPAAAGGGMEKRYWNAVFTPLTDGTGAIQHISCVVEDVTDRAHDPRLGKLLPVVDAIGLLFFDREGALISANDTFLRWSGYSREDLAAGAITWRTLTPPEYRAASEAERERLRSTGRIGPYEREYFAKDGARRWALFVGARLTDGSVAVYVVDVSARKAAEQAQRESEERYRSLFESIDSGFCVLEMIYDADGRPIDYRFLEVNPAFERQTGLRDATRKTMREHVPEHEQHWFDIYARVAESGEPVRFVQEAKPLMGGWYEVFAFRVGGPGSKRVGVLFNDISERVRAERALREAARRKDEFVATLAHELRNPLAPIRNAVTLLQMREDVDGEIRSIGEMIGRQVNHLARLIDDLMDVSRITFGKVQLRRSRLDLRDVAREAVTTCEPLVTASAHRLELELGAEPLWLDADRVRLAQVIANLLSNAVRYTPSGGRIVLRAARDGDEAEVSVEDDGIGIEPAMLERIFEPFVQLEQRQNGGATGIGIGLALARALAELHGGRLSAQSAGPGKGSRFAVRVPLAGAPQAADTPVTVGSGKPRRRWLLVDDNVDATKSQAAVLRR